MKQKAHTNTPPPLIYKSHKLAINQKKHRKHSPKKNMGGTLNTFNENNIQQHTTTYNNIKI